MRWYAMLVTLPLLTACGEDGDADMATTSNPEAYCKAHPDAMPDCAFLDLDACEAHPFCSPLDDAIECGATPLPGYKIVTVGCARSGACEDGVYYEGRVCNATVDAARDPVTGTWYMFLSGCTPAGWEHGWGEECEVPP